MENKTQQKEHWTYYLINTTNIYVKLVDNTSKAGNKYKSYYLYWNYGNQDILKFSVPSWDCYIVWDGTNRYLLMRVDKSNTNERTIKMVQQLESKQASSKVRLFSADYCFDDLDALENDNENDCEDYDY